MKSLTEFKSTLYCCMMNDCEKSYTTKFNLKRHVEIRHLKQKAHQCEFCSRKFVSPQNLKEHTFTHTGEKPYKCESCGEYFRQVSQLSLHKRNHEMGQKHIGYCLDAADLIAKPLTLTELVIQKIKEYPFCL